MTQLSLSGVEVSFGATTVLENVTFTIAAGEKWGVLGRNGAGKTTIFHLITGTLQPSSGSVARSPGLRVSLLEQHRDFGEATTVWDAVAGSFADLLELERSLAEQAAQLGELGESAPPQVLARYDRDLERFEREGGYTFAPRVDAILQGLGFDPVDARTRPLTHLSGGERGRVGLARQLAAPADVLLLDEPTNHLDLETTDWLEDYLQNADETVLVISHDRDFLGNVADHVLHVEHGTAVPYVADYVSFVAQRAERRLTQQRAFDRQRKFLSDEQDYIRRNIAGQNSKQAKGRRKRLGRLPRLSAPPSDEGAMAVRFTANDRGGDQVLVAERVKIDVAARGDDEAGERPVASAATPSGASGGSGVAGGPGAGGPPRIEDASSNSHPRHHSHAERAEPSQTSSRRTLIEHFSATVRRGDRVGLVGANGAGKSTLLGAILGRHPTAEGRLRLGGGISVAYYRQDLTQVPLDRTIYQVISDLRPMWERGAIMGHLGRFDFSGDEVMRSTATLSGGERARVALAMMMLSGANLLILDEPTNHLDVESIEALEDAVDRYEGSVILVSHDRALLRALTTRVWSLRDRRIAEFDGSFDEWEAVAEERAAATAQLAAQADADRRAREKERKAQERKAQERKATARAPGAVNPRAHRSDATASPARGSSSPDREQRAAQRRLQRAVEASETEIASLEARVRGLDEALADPDLYATAGGAPRAAALAADLAAARRSLDEAMIRWTDATEALERIG